MAETFHNRWAEKEQEATANNTDPQVDLENQPMLRRLEERGRNALKTPEQVAQERKEKTGGSLWGSSLAAVGAGGLGAGVLLGEALKMAMKVDFDAHGINAANDDATKMFSKGYDWAYGGKKAA